MSDLPFEDRFVLHLKRKLKVIENNLTRTNLRSGTRDELERKRIKLIEILGKWDIPKEHKEVMEVLSGI